MKKGQRLRRKPTVRASVWEGRRNIMRPVVLNCVVIENKMGLVIFMEDSYTARDAGAPVLIY